MNFLLLLISEDLTCPLGRLDYASLPQQALMEMFSAAYIPDHPWNKDQDGNFIDIEDWKGLSFDSDGALTKIFFEEGEGALDFEAIPASVTNFFHRVSGCTGTVPFDRLYSTIRFFKLFDADFYGTVDLTAIPRDLIDLGLGMNRFSGTLDFSNLPKKLVGLEVGQNEFSGIVNLRYIEKRIEEHSTQHFKLAERNATPPCDMPFGIGLFGNKFDGEILVKDIDKVSDRGQFFDNIVKYMVDEAGRKKLLHQQWI